MGRCAAVTGGLLWFGAVGLLAFAGPWIKSFFSEFGVALGSATVSTLRLSDYLSGHALISVGVLGAIVLMTFLVTLISRCVSALGVMFLLSAIVAWGFLTVVLALPALQLTIQTSDGGSV